jgi:hypothetical protein
MFLFAASIAASSDIGWLPQFIETMSFRCGFRRHVYS